MSQSAPPPTKQLGLGSLSLIRLSRSSAGPGTRAAATLPMGNPIFPVAGAEGWPERRDATGLRSRPEIRGERITTLGQPARCCQALHGQH